MSFMRTNKLFFCLLLVFPFLSTYAQKCKIGNTYYNSFEEANRAIPSNGTSTLVEILEDCDDFYADIAAKRNVIIDLNGHRLSCTKNNSAITVYGTLTIKGNGVIENAAANYTGDTDYRRAIWSSASSHTHIENGTFRTSSYSQTLCFNGDVVIDNAKVENHSDGACFFIYSDAKAEIYDGEFVNYGDAFVIGNSSTGTLTIHNGMFVNKDDNVGDYYGRALWTAAGSNTHIENGTFQTSCNAQALCFNGDVVIDNATVENSGTLGDGICVATFSNAKAEIYDGTFTGEIALEYESGDVNIHGGRFNVKNAFISMYGDETDAKNHVKLSGGVYSIAEAAAYVADAYEFVANDDKETSGDYPYMIREILYAMKVTCRNKVSYIKLTTDTRIAANNADNTVTVSTQDASVTLELQDVEKMEFVDYITDIKAPAIDNMMFELDGKTLRFSGKPSQDAVSIYTLDGHKCPTRLRDNSIDMSSYPSGVYMIKVNGRTIKTIIR